MTENRKNIVVNYSPFAMDQSVYYWEDADCVEHRRCSIEEVADVVYSLKKKYQVSKIDLVGPGEYLSKFKDKMMSNEYDFNNCVINIINR